MYGGSYNGFTQWAAAKQLHPALKTIVPYVGSEKINGHQVDKDALINTPEITYQWMDYIFEYSLS